jgi:hypothetical protein
MSVIACQHLGFGPEFRGLPGFWSLSWQLAFDASNSRTRGMNHSEATRVAVASRRKRLTTRIHVFLPRTPDALSLCLDKASSVVSKQLFRRDYPAFRSAAGQLAWPCAWTAADSLPQREGPA